MVRSIPSILWENKVEAASSDTSFGCRYKLPKILERIKRNKLFPLFRQSGDEKGERKINQIQIFSLRIRISILLRVKCFHTFSYFSQHCRYTCISSKLCQSCKYIHILFEYPVSLQFSTKMDESFSTSFKIWNGEKDKTAYKKPFFLCKKYDRQY